MKQRIFSMMRKWWVIALVFTLALSLTSCSRRRATQNSLYGLSYCDGIYGSFDVYTIKNPSLPGTYLITIMPASVTNPGDIVAIAVANSSNFAYKPLVTETALNQEQEISGQGYLTDSELNNYDRIVLYQPNPQLTFLQQDGASAQTCYLAAPGEMPQ